jgi:hypothetical protein
MLIDALTLQNSSSLPHGCASRRNGPYISGVLCSVICQLEIRQEVTAVRYGEHCPTQIKSRSPESCIVSISQRLILKGAIFTGKVLCLREATYQQEGRSYCTSWIGNQKTPKDPVHSSMVAQNDRSTRCQIRTNAVRNFAKIFNACEHTNNKASLRIDERAFIDNIRQK